MGDDFEALQEVAEMIDKIPWTITIDGDARHNWTWRTVVDLAARVRLGLPIVRTDATGIDVFPAGTAVRFHANWGGAVLSEPAKRLINNTIYQRITDRVREMEAAERGLIPPDSPA